jgi:hypothetical protein
MTNQFLWGGLAVSCAIAGLFFLKFWTSTRDRLFLSFAAAFWILGLSWAGLAILNPADDSRHYVYVVRLAAFLIIIVGIIDKNRASPRRF